MRPKNLEKITISKSQNKEQLERKGDFSNKESMLSVSIVGYRYPSHGR